MPTPIADAVLIGITAPSTLIPPAHLVLARDTVEALCKKLPGRMAETLYAEIVQIGEARADLINAKHETLMAERHRMWQSERDDVLWWQGKAAELKRGA